MTCSSALTQDRNGAEKVVHPDLLAAIPDSVLLRLFEAVAQQSKRDLCTVSRLNKRYHALADAVLYKTVLFLNPELHLLFSESLSRRPRRGSAIQHVKLAYPSHELTALTIDAHAPVHGYRPQDAALRFDSLPRAIAAMSNLETLDISVPVTLLHGIGQLFNGPFDLACLKSASLFYQCPEDGYWDLRENIHIFAHPTLESLTLRRARLDYRGFDLMEQPHATALKKLHLVECDINDDALSDLLVFPEALQEFVMTQLEDPQPELEESSDMFRDYMVAIDSAAASLETVTIDFPSLAGHKPLALREFEKLTTLRMNWDYQLFGKTSRKPRLQSVGLPPSLETLEFFGELGRDEEVTELLAHMIEHLDLHAAKLKRIVVGEGSVPPEVKAACLKHPRLRLDVIGEFDVSDDEGEEQSEKEEQGPEKSRESFDDDEKPDGKPEASHEEWPKLEHDGIFKDNLHSATHQVVDMEVDNRTDTRV
ncbi:conserved hypothetical protein [Verticillium alfalfae VaMs.102]|uniref:F-box domain-containing protein n=1 Tax=Verticillium alfalfae (strain VaMs.102 / ATCC MYA-4576 / FGSC 10136) TaxID=526221 RepID=C9SIF2_VERA1|nr:conserved hypothetical protein [Verticillium alfalfae VaMs.102]EEY18725.1 conserved hypothetical protein [Verticillium alfalfae VaMs.102]